MVCRVCVYDDVTYVYDDVTYVFYHKTVNALSARVTEGVPTNDTLSTLMRMLVSVRTF